MYMIKHGDTLDIGISEPADIGLDDGSPIYLGNICVIDGDNIEIEFDRPIHYKGNIIESCVAKPRHAGDSFIEWDGKSVIIVNMVVNLPGLTHLIGGIRLSQIK